MIDIYCSCYDLVQFRADSKAEAERVVEWAKEAAPYARVCVFDFQHFAMGSAHTALGFGGRTTFEVRFSDALREFIAAGGKHEANAAKDRRHEMRGHPPKRNDAIRSRGSNA